MKETALALSTAGTLSLPLSGGPWGPGHCLEEPPASDSDPTAAVGPRDAQTTAPSSDKPKVSIGLPIYNGEKFLAQTLDSLLAQTYLNIELIISDNGSTDRTPEICRAYAARDKRIRFYRSEENRGAAWNFNRTFKLATGEFFKWAAHDDLCQPLYLEKCVQAMEAEPDIVLCFPRLVDIDEYGQPLRSRRSQNVSSSASAHQRFAMLIQMNHTCEEVFGLARTEILGQTGLIGAYSDSDRVLLSHLGLFGRLHEVPEELFLHRLHAGSSVQQYPDREERTVWFDPRAAGKTLYPYWRELHEFCRVVPRSPLGFWDRMRCYVHLMRWMLANRRRLYVDLRWAAICSLGRRAPWLRNAYRGLKKLMSPAYRARCQTAGDQKNQS